MAESKEIKNIFNPVGGLSQSTFINADQTPFNAFITIFSVATGDRLLGTAPVTGVLIQQLTDFSLTKSLNKDFLVATFGDTPTKIQLKGISFFNLNGCSLSGKKANQQILAFYKKNKISTNINNRVDIAIAEGKDKAPVAFRCVIVGLDSQNQSSADGIGNSMYDYTMQLIGVERSVENRS